MAFFNKKGSALMQVMVLGSIIAAIIVMLMRFSVGRTTNMLKTKRTVEAKEFFEACMAQYNTMAMERAMAGYPPYIDPSSNAETFTCNVDIHGKGELVSKNITVRWGSTTTGLGIIAFDMDVEQLE